MNANLFSVDSEQREDKVRKFEKKWAGQDDVCPFT